MEFKVNNAKQDYSMKLGEGGEAFFVFETSEDIPESLQTSPVISPATSPQSLSLQQNTSLPTLQEPEFLDLNIDNAKQKSVTIPVPSRPMIIHTGRAKSDLSKSIDLNSAVVISRMLGTLTPVSTSPDGDFAVQTSAEWLTSRSLPPIKRSASEDFLPRPSQNSPSPYLNKPSVSALDGSITPPAVPATMAVSPTDRSASPPPVSADEAVNRAKALSEKLSGSNIPSRITESGDLMLDMTGYKSKEEDALRAEVIARKILSEELEGNYDIGALIGADEHGNLWIYSSEEAKEAASHKIGLRGLAAAPAVSDAVSDPGYHSDDEALSSRRASDLSHHRTKSDAGPTGLVTPPETPPVEVPSGGDPNRNYAKTLRLTSDQLRALHLIPGANTMSFSVNRATCHAHMFYWKYDVPIVISDIDGTITKSDALGHVLNMIGRDWTHIGVAKLYTDIVANGYNILYLTSRSVGQADTTRAYLNGVSQEGFRLPKGPVIMSPDRTIAALRREIYLRKPEVFKMACLRDILNLFSQKRNPFYAGFGNRLTDALSYRSVNIPSTRIFTINSNAEVSLDLLTLNKYKSSYVTMREIVDHFFPPVGLLVTGGGEEYTDFNYWRDAPADIDDFSDSDSENYGKRAKDKQSLRSEDEGSEGLDEDEQIDEMGESYLSQESTVEQDELVDSILESLDEGSFVTDEDAVQAGDDGVNAKMIDVNLGTLTGTDTVNKVLVSSKSDDLPDPALNIPPRERIQGR